MLIKKLAECEKFIAGDSTVLRELLNPGKEELSIRYSLAHAVLGSKETSKPHKLKTSEVYFIIEGTGLMHIDEESQDVGSGDAIYIPPGTVQYIRNTGGIGLRFLCIVDPAWRPEDEEVL